MSGTLFMSDGCIDFVRDFPLEQSGKHQVHLQRSRANSISFAWARFKKKKDLSAPVFMTSMKWASAFSAGSRCDDAVAVAVRPARREYGRKEKGDAADKVGLHINEIFFFFFFSICN